MEAGGQPDVVGPASFTGALTSFRLLQVVLFGLTVVGVVIGCRITVPGGIAPASSVAFGLTLAWALVGLVDTRARDRSGSKASPFHLLAAADALVAAVALTAGRQAETVHASSGAAGHRHAGRTGRDSDFVPFPSRAARRPVARLGPAGHGQRRLPRGRGRRARLRGEPPAVQPGRRSGQLDHRGSAGDRAVAQSLHRVHRLLPGTNGMVRHRRVPRRHSGAGRRPSYTSSSGGPGNLAP